MRDSPADRLDKRIAEIIEAIVASGEERKLDLIVETASTDQIITQHRYRPILF